MKKTLAGYKKTVAANISFQIQIEKLHSDAPRTRGLSRPISVRDRVSPSWERPYAEYATYVDTYLLDLSCLHTYVKDFL